MIGSTNLGGGSTLTDAEVVAKSWHPTNTDWKVLRHEFGQWEPNAATNNHTMADGNISFVFVHTGTSVAYGPGGSYEDRWGIGKFTSGTSTGALSGFEQQLEQYLRAGDFRIKMGCAFRPNVKPTTTSGERRVINFGLGDNVSTFASNRIYWYFDPSQNADNWVISSGGTSSAFNDSGEAFDLQTWTNLEIDVAADLSDIKYYKDGALAYTETTAANIPAAGTALNFQGAIRAIGAMTQVEYFEFDWAYMAIKPENAIGSITTWLE